MAYVATPIGATLRLGDGVEFSDAVFVIFHTRIVLLAP
jgi:hypothetical protein